ncbi:hypothetical protein SEA_TROGGLEHUMPER_92 [Rhodococcus phage Trogglehumper]|uniref:Uncharacterized protein n=1 Tax=Rhodococcus phage Trogglehumper TaxID=3038381 RepID=A0AAF0GIJ3_9CAUD|nr:hypothetical protein SEA_TROGGLEHUMPER_92 [Rhodococcus phage Trogglehumper]
MTRRTRDVILQAIVDGEKVTTRVAPDDLPMVMTLVARYITGEFRSGQTIERLYNDRSGQVRRFKAKFTQEQAIEYRRQLVDKGYWK